MTKDELKYKLKLAIEKMNIFAQECNELEDDLRLCETKFEACAIVVEQLEEQLAKMED